MYDPNNTQAELTTNDVPVVTEPANDLAASDAEGAEALAE